MSVFIIITLIVLVFIIIYQISKASEYATVLRGQEKMNAQANRAIAWLLVIMFILGMWGIWECNELFKGIMDDTASGVFNGHVLVRRDAQKTNAFQRNKNILLTDKAKVNSKPFLEIYADDVKCSHGATVGQLDTEAMFYIRSRGISEDSARMLLMYAFCDEIIQKITVEPLKHRLEDMVKKRLRGELSVCAQCVLHCSHPEKEFNFEIDLSKI